MDTNLNNCSVNLSAFWGPDNQLMRDPVIGAVCPAGAPNCGVHLTSVQFDVPSMTFKAEIDYEGTEVAIAPIKINMKIPTDILASEMQYVCPLSKPIFQGYDAAGNITCNAFPQTCSNGLNLNTQGVYIAKLDPKSLAPICNQLGDGTTTKCASAEYLSSYSWATGSFSSVCVSRPDPFTAYPYTQPGPTAASYVITGTTYSNTTSSTTTTTTTTTSTTSTSTTTTTLLPTFPGALMGWYGTSAYFCANLSCSLKVPDIGDAAIQIVNCGAGQLAYRFGIDGTWTLATPATFGIGPVISPIGMTTLPSLIQNTCASIF
jgi:hypothetical protein